MAWDGIWRTGQGTQPAPDQVKLLQHRALHAFGSYAVPLGVTENGVFDAATSAFVKEFQRRKNDSGYTPRLPANRNASPGDVDYETRKALGILPTPPAPVTQKYVGYAVPGTWGVWNIGPQCMAVNRSPDKVFLQGVGYNTSAFLNPDPQHSYVEAVNEGVGELLRLSLPDFRPKFVAGYSMGAEVVARFLAAWPAERRQEIIQVFTFGSPSRPPGATKYSGPLPGAGISGFYTPDWARAREWSYAIDGDMYCEAEGLLPSFYQLAVRAEASPEFAMYLFGWMTGIPIGGFGAMNLFGNVSAPPSPIGAGLLGLDGNSAANGFGMLSGILDMITGNDGMISLPEMIFNIPLIIGAIMQAMKFVGTNAHGRYWVDPIFFGMTAEDHAASVVRQLAV